MMQKKRLFLFPLLLLLLLLISACTPVLQEESSTVKSEEATVSQKDSEITEKPSESESDAAEEESKDTGALPPRHTHTVTRIERKEPTCTEDGNLLYFLCGGCGKKYSDASAEAELENPLLPKLSHDLDHFSEKAPTCTDKGYAAYVACKRCAYSTYSEKEALRHDIEAHTARAATCTEIGWTSYETCKRCNYSTYTEIKATGHDVAYVTAKPATCTETGWDAYEYCRNCSYDTKNELPLLSHVYGNGMYCTACSAEKTGSDGLVFTASSDESYYILTAVDTPAEEIVVPSSYLGRPVKAIGSHAFQGTGNQTLNTVTKKILLPKSVESIEDYAFRYCITLEEIEIPSGVTKIGKGIFSFTASLFSVRVDEENESFFDMGNCIVEKGNKCLVAGGGNAEIPADGSVTRIAPEAFNGVKNLTEICLPAEITEIGEYAFSYCERLYIVTNLSCLPIELGSDAYGGIAKNAVHLCESLTCDKHLTDENGYVLYTEGEQRILLGYRGREADLTLPEGIAKIAANAFSYTWHLKTVTISASVTEIGEQVFMFCGSLETVTLSDGTALSCIEKRAFAMCEALQAFCFPDTAERWREISKVNPWNAGTGDYTVFCTDTVVQKNEE